MTAERTETRILTELLRGKGAHADPVACFDALTPELAGRVLPGAEHTVWQLLVHVNYWMDYEVRSIEGTEPPYPEHASASWPVESGPRDRSAWEKETAHLRQQLDRLAEFAGQGNERLARIVHPSKGETVRDVLWQMAAHNSYHVGQVALLRRAFGAWPPPAGGDTW
ncbi:MAG: DinB family protein [Gemmatimonadales bacterium]